MSVFLKIVSGDIEEITAEEKEFIFIELKPGKYIEVTPQEYEKAKKEDVNIAKLNTKSFEEYCQDIKNEFSFL